MITIVQVVIDTQNGCCTIQEDGAEPAEYGIANGSIEAIAEDTGEALTDYMRAVVVVV